MSGLTRGGTRRIASRSYRSILGANLRASWHSQFGVGLVSGNVDTWTDQISGRVLTAPTSGKRLSYAADGANFGGRTVLQTALSGVKTLQNIALTGFAASGSRPWVFIRYRVRSLNTGFCLVVSMGGAAGGNYYLLNHTTTDIRVASDTSGSTVGPAGDTNVHTAVYGLDGTNYVLILDGVTYGNGSTGALPVDIGKIAVGSFAGDSAAGGVDASIAVILVCAAKPTAAQISAVTAKMQLEFS